MIKLMIDRGYRSRTKPEIQICGRFSDRWRTRSRTSIRATCRTTTSRKGKLDRPETWSDMLIKSHIIKEQYGSTSTSIRDVDHKFIQNNKPSTSRTDKLRSITMIDQHNNLLFEIGFDPVCSGLTRFDFPLL